METISIAVRKEQLDLRNHRFGSVAMRKLPTHDLILIAFVLWIGSYTYLYIYQLTYLKPLYTYFALLGFAAFRFSYAPNTLIIRGKGVQQVLVWILAFGIYTCSAWLISSHTETASQIFITWMESALILAAFLLLFCNTKKTDQIQMAFALIAIISVAINLYDFLFFNFSAISGRAAGFYGNPNISGRLIAMCMVAGISIVPRGMRLWYVLLCGLGVLVTFSRSSWLTWGVGFILLAWIGVIGPVRYRTVSVFLIAIAAIIMFTLLFGGNLGEAVVNSPLTNYLNADTSTRLEGRLDDNSARERTSIIKEGLEQGAKAPLLGHGLGFTREPGSGWSSRVSTHNMYLLFWAEGGVFGLTVYLWLIILLIRYSGGVGRVITLQYALAGFFTHNLLDQPASLMILAFALIPKEVLYRQTTHNPLLIKSMERT